MFKTFLGVDFGSLGQVALPGGTGDEGTNRDDDDFEIVLATPSTAVGLLIVHNKVETGETVTAFDQSGQIASAALPGGTGGTDGDGFIGFVVDAGDDPIILVRVDEGASSSPLDDDIGFDLVSIAVPLEVPALRWRGLTLLAVLLLISAALRARTVLSMDATR